MPNAIVIGASSGIGESLAIELAAAGYSLGLAARRMDRLNAIAANVATRAFTRMMDLRNPDEAAAQLHSLVSEMGEVDLIVISSGVGHLNPEFAWQPELETMAVNVVGFARLANAAALYFESRGAGHLVGISSIAAIRGHGGAPAYGASKAFVSSYLQAIRHRFAKAGLPICVTDIQPGFVDTAMAKGDGQFWVAPPQQAARQILRAIQTRRSHVYVTKRWRFIAWLLRWLPNWAYHKL